METIIQTIGTLLSMTLGFIIISQTIVILILLHINKNLKSINFSTYNIAKNTLNLKKKNENKKM